jgi:hypothetical protein
MRFMELSAAPLALIPQGLIICKKILKRKKFTSFCTTAKSRISLQEGVEHTYRWYFENLSGA